MRYENEHKKKAIVLSLIWIFTGLPIYIISFLREAWRTDASIDAFSKIDWYEPVLLLAVLFYFIPLLRRIKFHANLAKMKKITLISHIFLILFYGASFIALVSILLTTCVS